MASRFVRAEIIKAGAGSSATALSAYIARDIRQDLAGDRFNFAHRADELDGVGLILPADAPEWAADAARVWREAERAEQTVDRQTGELRWKKGGQVAKHMTIALPREANAEQREAMLLEFVAKEIDPQEHGVVVEWAIHRDGNNPHAHLLISTRTIAGAGFGKKARAMNPDFASKGGAHFIGEAENWDVRWAEFQRVYFERLGIAADIRERKTLPEEHYTRGQLKTPGVIDEREKIAVANEAAERVRLRDPAQILESLIMRQAIFTWRDVRRAVHKSGLEGPEREVLAAAIIAQRDVMALVDRGGNKIGWTTRQVREEEFAILSSSKRIAAPAGAPLGRRGKAQLAAADLSAEQRAAADRATDGRQIAIVIGRAGTGKSHTMNAARHAFESEGYRVVGLAPTNSVVGNLRKDGYGHAATLYRELGQLERDPTRWDRKTVVMVDEAAMIDNVIMAKLMTGVERTGAKLILTGDDRQFASVSRGGMFTELVNLHGAARLEIVKDDGATVAFDPAAYDKWGLGYSGTGYKGQGKTQVKTAAFYDNPYAWDMRAAYVIGTRHKEEYQLFVPRELAPDLTALTGQVMRQRDDKGSSLRFETAEAYKLRHGLAVDAALQRPPAERPAPSPTLPERSMAPRPAPERGPSADEIAAGLAGFRERFELHKRQQAAALARDEQARTLVSQWDRLAGDYKKALSGLEADPTLGGTRAALLGFGHSLRTHPEAVTALRERGPEFGVKPDGTLARVLAAKEPGRVITDAMEGAEKTMRHQLKLAADREAARLLKQSLSRGYRGPGTGR